MHSGKKRIWLYQNNMFLFENGWNSLLTSPPRCPFYIAFAMNIVSALAEPSDLRFPLLLLRNGYSASLAGEKLFGNEAP